MMHNTELANLKLAGDLYDTLKTHWKYGYMTNHNVMLESEAIHLLKSMVDIITAIDTIPMVSLLEIYHIGFIHGQHYAEE